MNRQDRVVSSNFSFFRSSDNELITPISIDLSSTGEFVALQYVDENNNIQHLDRCEFIYTNLVLHIPGFGIVRCGDQITLEEPRKAPKIYTLDFGWHENKSHQKIYSWYLIPTIDKRSTNSALYKTLYYDDLENVVGVQNTMPGILPPNLIELN